MPYAGQVWDSKPQLRVLERAGVIRATGQSTDGTVATTDDIFVSYGGIDKTVTLPAIASLPSGRVFTVKRRSDMTHTVTVVSADGTPIDGATSKVLATAGSAVTVCLHRVIDNASATVREEWIVI